MYRGWMSDPYMGYGDYGGLLDPQGYGMAPQGPSYPNFPAYGSPGTAELQGYPGQPPGSNGWADSPGGYDPHYDLIAPAGTNHPALSGHAPSSWAGSPYDGRLYSPPMTNYGPVAGFSQGEAPAPPPQTASPQSAAPASPTRDAVLAAIGGQNNGYGQG